jgi:ABC-type Fe3+-siderophore transport system permease subunit
MDIRFKAALQASTIVFGLTFIIFALVIALLTIPYIVAPIAIFIVLVGMTYSLYCSIMEDNKRVQEREEIEAKMKNENSD